MGGVWEDLPVSCLEREKEQTKGRHMWAKVVVWGHLAEHGKGSRCSRGHESLARIHGFKDLCKWKECALEPVTCEQSIWGREAEGQAVCEPSCPGSVDAARNWEQRTGRQRGHRALVLACWAPPFSPRSGKTQVNQECTSPWAASEWGSQCIHKWN